MTKTGEVIFFPKPRLMWRTDGAKWFLENSADKAERHGKLAGWVYVEPTHGASGFRACVPTVHNPDDGFDEIDLGTFGSLQAAQAAVRSNVPPEQLWL
ncbi:MAG: hypothetical protein ACYDHY_09445 [Acidiferrobacterales bacterium]